MSMGAGNKVYIPVVLDDVTGALAVYIPVPEKCEVTKITSCIDQAITGNLAITAKIGGTAVTGGAISVTASGSASGDIDVATPTALNQIAAGGSLELEFDGTPTAGGTCVVLVELTKGPLGPKTA